MASLAKNLNNVKRNLKGVIPVYKPSGTSAHTIMKFIQSDLAYCLGPNYIKLSYGCYLEPFASGVFSLHIGSLDDLRRHLNALSCKYRAKVKFGEQRLTDSVQGPVIGHSPFNHLNEKLITDVASEFLGTIKLERPVPVETQPKYVHEDLVEPPKGQQKYPLVLPGRLVKCSSIELVQLALPHAEFNISCSRDCSVRRLLSDLANKLGTKASLMELERTEEGPFTLADAKTQIYHLHYEILSLRIDRNNLLRVMKHLRENSEEMSQPVTV